MSWCVSFNSGAAEAEIEQIENDLLKEFIRRVLGKLSLCFHHKIRGSNFRNSQQHPGLSRIPALIGSQEVMLLSRYLPPKTIGLVATGTCWPINSANLWVCATISCGPTGTRIPENQGSQGSNLEEYITKVPDSWGLRWISWVIAILYRTSSQQTQLSSDNRGEECNGSIRSVGWIH